MFGRKFFDAFTAKSKPQKRALLSVDEIQRRIAGVELESARDAIIFAVEMWRGDVESHGGKLQWEPTVYNALEGFTSEPTEATAVVLLLILPEFIGIFEAAKEPGGAFDKSLDPSRTAGISTLCIPWISWVGKSALDCTRAFLGRLTESYKEGTPEYDVRRAQMEDEFAFFFIQFVDRVVFDRFGANVRDEMIQSICVGVCDICTSRSKEWAVEFYENARQEFFTHYNEATKEYSNRADPFGGRGEPFSSIFDWCGKRVAAVAGFTILTIVEIGWKVEQTCDEFVAQEGPSGMAGLFSYMDSVLPANDSRAARTR